MKLLFLFEDLHVKEKLQAMVHRLVVLRQQVQII